MAPYVIRDMVKKGKSKSVIVPNGGAVLSGQTNATNPTTLRELQDNFHDYQRASKVSLEILPPKPAKVMPHINEQYKRMGDMLGICPYELEAIMKAEFTEDQELAISLLKKFVSAVKLSAATDLSKAHKVLKDASDRYNEMMKGWHKKVKAVDAQNEKVAEEKTRTRAALYQAWGNILIDLSQKVMRNADIKSLGEWDQLMLKALERTNTVYCKIDNGVVNLDFKACKGMIPEYIGYLPSLARQIQNEIEEAKWHSWLNNATVEDLMSELWKCDDEDDQRRIELEWAITAKEGRIPIRDKWGNLNWHATYHQDMNNLDILEELYGDDYDFDEEYDIKRMKDLIEARAAIGLSPRGHGKVKSGSGKPTK